MGGAMQSCAHVACRCIARTEPTQLPLYTEMDDTKFLL